MAIKTEEKKIVARIKFSYQEVEDLKSELEPYKTEITCDTDFPNSKKGDKIKVLKVKDELKYLEDKGIIKIYEGKNYGVLEDKLIQYEEHGNKMTMLYKLEGKKNYAKRMEIKEYEKVASSMPTVEEETPF